MSAAARQDAVVGGRDAVKLPASTQVCESNDVGRGPCLSTHVPVVLYALQCHRLPIERDPYQESEDQVAWAVGAGAALKGLSLEGHAGVVVVVDAGGDNWNGAGTAAPPPTSPAERHRRLERAPHQLGAA